MRNAVGRALTVWTQCLVLASGALPASVIAAPVAAASPPSRNGAPATPASEAVVRFIDWVTASGDNRGLPFVVVDKIGARVFVFSADGRMLGTAAALIGVAHGDDSTPGVGDRELSNIPLKERTTPAGRFVGALGPALGEKEVLWVDYGAAISLHPVIVADPKERRLQRLQTTTPLDNRITHGCINVPTAFYEDVVHPVFAGTKGVVYILPETRSLNDVFPDFQVQANVEPAAPAPEDAPPPPPPRRTGKRKPAPPRPQADPSARSGQSPSATQSGLGLVRPTGEAPKSE